MSDLPPPLVPADADLRGFEMMPLDVTRLRRSKAWLICKRSPHLAFYMINLWTAAWHERPAGSLEDDDDVLADLAMCDPAKWDKLRDLVLRNWVKCSDGRLYHPFLAEKVLTAWDSRLDQRWRTECARIKKHNDRHRMSLHRPSFDEWMYAGCPSGQRLPVPRDVPEDKSGTDKRQGGETPSKGEGEGKGEGKLKPKPLAADAARPKKPDEDPVKREVWTTGRTLLEAQGMTHDQAGTFLGKLVKDHGQVRVLEVIREAARDAKADVKTWLVAACQERGRAPKPTGREAAAAAIFSDAPSLASREVIDGFAERVV